MNRYYFRYKFTNLDDPSECECDDGEEEEGEIVDAESLEQAEIDLFAYNLSYFSIAQAETVEIISRKFMGEVPDEHQLRFAI